MKLLLKERTGVLGVIPPNGKYEELKIVKAIVEKLAFSDEEREKYIEEDENGVRMFKKEFDNEEFEFEFAPEEIELVVKSLKELEEKGSLSVQHVDLYEKFV